MPSLEQSLILHDKFSKVLNKVNNMIQTTLGQFESLNRVASRGLNLNLNVPRISTPFSENMFELPTFIQPKPMSVEMRTDEALKKLENLYGYSQDLQVKLDDVSHSLSEAFSIGDNNAIENSIKDYNNLLNEMGKVKNQAQNINREIMRMNVPAPNMKTDGVGNNSPPMTRVQRLHIEADTKPAENAFKRLVNTIKHQEVAPFKDTANQFNQQVSKMSLLPVFKQVNDLKDKLMNFNFNPFQKMPDYTPTFSINKFISKFQQLDSYVTSSVQGMGNKVSNSLSNAFNKIPLVNRLTSSIGSLKERLGAAEGASNRLNQSTSRVTNNAGKYGLLNSMIGKVSQSTMNLSRRLLGVKSSSEQANQSMSRVAQNQSHYSRLGSTLNLMRSSFQRFTDTIRKSEGSGNRLLNVLSKIPGPIGRAFNSMDKFNNKMKEANGNAKNLNRISGIMTFNLAINALRTMSNIMGGLIAKADSYVSTMNRLKIANDGTESLESFNERIMASAIRSRTAYDEVSRSVSRLAINAKDAFNSNDEVITFAESLNKLYKISGATLQEQQGSMIQLTQAMARGVLRGEELNSVWEQGPLIIQKISDYLGVTQGELKAMADEGEITAEIVKAAILSATEDINNQFNQMDMTFTQMVENFKTYSIGAFQPLIESWSEFINSVQGQAIFEGLVIAIYTLANVANWAFNQIIIPALQWVAENANILKMAFLTLAGAAMIAGIIIATAFLIANWPMLLIIGSIMLIIYALDAMGITAGQVAGFIIGAAVAIYTAFYNTVVAIVGIFEIGIEIIINIFVYFANQILSVAEFFVNVWSNPIYAVRKLFYNLVDTALKYFESFGNGVSSAANALGRMFVEGANIAIRAINGVIGLLNKIPGINIGVVGEVGGGSVSAFQGIRNMIDPGEAPSNYKSLQRFEHVPMDGFSKMLGNFKNPWTEGYEAYKSVSGVIDNLGNWSGMEDFMNKINQKDLEQADINKILGDLYDPSNYGGGNGGDDGKGGSGGKGKKPNVGTVDKVKDEIDISNEDLKYLKDIAERNFVLNFEQITPSATVNFESSGNTEEDAIRLLEMMEQMIREQTSSRLDSN